MSRSLLSRRVRAIKGFSLIELLVSLAVLGVLASVALPLVEMTVQREKERELKRALWEIRDALDAYRHARESGGVRASEGGRLYPSNLEELMLLQADARPERAGQPLRFLRQVPRDPFADPTVPAARSWGLRSYASEANHPQAGADVYDVYSNTDRVGLNGVPLRQW